MSPKSNFPKELGILDLDSLFMLFLGIQTWMNPRFELPVMAIFNFLTEITFCHYYTSIYYQAKDPLKIVLLDNSAAEYLMIIKL